MKKLHLKYRVYYFLAVIFLVWMAIIAFHFEEDWSFHEDCPVCLAQAYTLFVQTAVINLDIYLVNCVSIIEDLSQQFTNLTFIRHFNCRAPPAFFLLFNL